jgi:hypothetical protein
MWLVLLFYKKSTIEKYKSYKIEKVGNVGYLPVFDDYNAALEFANGDVTKLQEIDYE